MEARIYKMDDERHFVFGWASVAIRASGEQVIDHAGDMVDVEDLENAAYQFVLDFRGAGEMHEGDVIGQLIESFMVTPEKLEAMGLSGTALPLGWWVGFWIQSDVVWAKVKSGEYAMFSIQGYCYPEEVDDAA